MENINLTNNTPFTVIICSTIGDSFEYLLIDSLRTKLIVNCDKNFNVENIFWQPRSWPWHLLITTFDSLVFSIHNICKNALLQKRSMLSWFVTKICTVSKRELIEFHYLGSDYCLWIPETTEYITWTNALQNRHYIFFNDTRYILRCYNTTI